MEILHEDKAVVIGHHCFYDVEVIEDVINGGLVLVSHIYNAETNGSTSIRQVICTAWYNKFRQEALSYNDSIEYKHNQKQIVHALRSVTV